MNQPVEDIAPTSPWIDEYSELLDRHHIAYKPVDYYLQVGEITETQGWLLHVSVIISQIEELLSTIIPALMYEGLSFRIPKDRGTARMLLEGNLGYTQLGKILTVYPEPAADLPSLAGKLIEWTKPFRGPAIPTDAWLGACLYARYGSFNPVLVMNETGGKDKYIYGPGGTLVKDDYSIPFQLSKDRGWPFGKIPIPVPPKEKTKLKKIYKIDSAIKSDSRGNVFRALYPISIFKIGPCIIKHARKNMSADSHGRDMKDRLLWQNKLHKELKGIVALPTIIDFFEEDGDAYLVMEFIKGVSLYDLLLVINGGSKSWLALSAHAQLTILDYLLKMVTSLDRLHQAGIVHRDTTPANFIVTESQELVLIDIELAYSLRSQEPSPPFGLGTFGYMSPEQFSKLTPTIKEDIYGLSASLLQLIIGLSPLKFKAQDPGVLYNHLNFFIRNDELSKLIAAGLQPDPHARPQLSEIRTALEKIRDHLLAGEAAARETPFRQPSPHEVADTVAHWNTGFADPQADNQEDSIDIDSKDTDNRDIDNRDTDNGNTNTYPDVIHDAARRTGHDYDHLDPIRLDELISQALRGLVLSPTVIFKEVWASPSFQRGGINSNEQREYSRYPGLYEGLSGILYFLARAKMAGTDIGPCLPTYHKAWDYLREEYLDKLSEMVPGLYYGSAGLGLALASGITAGLLENNDRNKRLVQQCLEQIPGLEQVSDLDPILTLQPGIITDTLTDPTLASSPNTIPDPGAIFDPRNSPDPDTNPEPDTSPDPGTNPEPDISSRTSSKPESENIPESGVTAGLGFAPPLNVVSEPDMDRELDIARGIAGHGIAILQSADVLGEEQAKILLNAIAWMLIDSQEQDGSWILKNKKYNNQHQKIMGMANGAAGIAWFLMEFGRRYDHEAAKSAGLRSIAWLRRKTENLMKLFDEKIYQEILETEILEDGAAGIIISFIKAYEVSGDPQLKEMIVNILHAYPLEIISNNLDQSGGLSGLGELYLEAWQVFGEEQWKSRADWIANLLLHTHIANPTAKSCHWILNETEIVTADFMTGTSGLIEFFIRCLHPDKLGYRLLK